MSISTRQIPSFESCAEFAKAIEAEGQRFLRYGLWLSLPSAMLLAIAALSASRGLVLVSGACLALGLICLLVAASRSLTASAWFKASRERAVFSYMVKRRLLFVVALWTLFLLGWLLVLPALPNYLLEDSGPLSVDWVREWLIPILFTLAMLWPYYLAWRRWRALG